MSVIGQPGRWKRLECNNSRRTTRNVAIEPVEYNSNGTEDSRKPWKKRIPHKQFTMVASTRGTKRDAQSRAHMLYPLDEKRDALQDMSDNPELHGDKVIYVKKDFVLAIDKTPRASVHLLLLPRDQTKYELHPLEAYADPVFRANIQAEIPIAKKIAADRLKKMYKKTASADRDWEAEIRTGFHVLPSMNHLHIHIISTDFCNTEQEWTGRQYLAMGTAFFTSLDELPLPDNDPRQKRDKALLFSGRLKCWRCGKDFGPQTNWPEFKKHLDKEAEVWKKL